MAKNKSKKTKSFSTNKKYSNEQEGSLFDNDGIDTQGLSDEQIVEILVLEKRMRMIQAQGTRSANLRRRQRLPVTPDKKRKK